jgi:prepilin-type N-terminal cleavage/methylation domain-containing protein
MRGIGRKQAFTLIELLIVVAIIAILAAIAVPNFLEAQTRSKIARTKADMKTIVTALRMYEVDNNHALTYRYKNDEEYAALGLTVPFSFFLKTDWQPPSIGVRLTTPIAYLTDIPWDFFNTNAWTTPKGRHSSVMMHSKDLSLVPFLLPPNHTWHWALESAGPDNMWYQDAADPSSPLLEGLYYDPTNGTVSGGDLWYHDAWGFGTGFGSPADLEY